VNNAAKPDKKAIRKILNKEELSFFSSIAVFEFPSFKLFKLIVGD